MWFLVKLRANFLKGSSAQPPRSRDIRYVGNGWIVANVRPPRAVFGARHGGSNESVYSVKKPL